MKRCIIITAFITGTIRHSVSLSAQDYIICSDGGFQLARKEDILPQLVIGDLDSVTEKPDSLVETQIYPVEKDDTDTMLCIKYAAERDFDEICLIGGMGGRLDHTLGNLQAMAWAAEYWQAQGKNSRRIRMVDNQNDVLLMTPGQILLEGVPGEKLSLISHSDCCLGVTTSRLKWELVNAQLTNRFPLGISNEFADISCQITLEEGMLLILRCRDMEQH
ncbi:thiamine diphosphokinase [Aminipila butyrica]|uniref:Thiamine diphosphokinase n=1 Tax=Aminipila butyrica TaxID=433296 RepID=A0A858BUM1_9FIRM|nr:thiamine diphosphokinase [Aminipila butyrica]QIB69062.1 thiamine diphosphokinase [Aminipila butyrica]